MSQDVVHNGLDVLELVVTCEADAKYRTTNKVILENIIGCKLQTKV